MPLTWQIRDRTTSGNPVVSVSEAVWRQKLSRYIMDIDKYEKSLTPDVNFCAFPDIDLWMTNGSFNPGLPFTGPKPSGLKETHRRNNMAGVGQLTE